MYSRRHISWQAPGQAPGQAIVEYLLLLSFVVLIMLKVGSFIQNSFKKGAPILKEVVIEQNLETGIGFK